MQRTEHIYSCHVQDNFISIMSSSLFLDYCDQEFHDTNFPDTDFMIQIFMIKIFMIQIFMIQAFMTQAFNWRPAVEDWVLVGLWILRGAVF